MPSDETVRVPNPLFREVDGMATRRDNISDPEHFVDEFGRKINEWQEWYEKWKSYASQGRGIPGDTYFKGLDDWTLRMFDDMAQMLRTQEQVNIMMLAAIDDLKRRLNNLEHP